jgi:hypothetical protein
MCERLSRTTMCDVDGDGTHGRVVSRSKVLLASRACPRCACVRALCALCEHCPHSVTVALCVSTTTMMRAKVTVRCCGVVSVCDHTLYI